MFSTVTLVAAAIGTYVGLGAAVTYGRPPVPTATSPSGPVSRPPIHDRVVEGAWIAGIALVTLYPIAVIVAPNSMLSAPFALRFPGDAYVEAIGIVVLALAVILLGTSFRALGAFATVRLEVTDRHRIVQEGPYVGIRHPMYSAVIGTAIGISLIFLGWLPSVVTVGLVLLAWIRSETEERLFLTDPRLAAEYEQYVARTGRFLPYPRGRRSRPASPLGGHRSTRGGSEVVRDER